MGGLGYGYGNSTNAPPLRPDDGVMNTTQQWAHDIKRNRHIGDFSEWKDHDTYQKAFERLLRDLKAERGEGTDER